MSDLQKFMESWYAKGSPIRPPFEHAVHCTDMAYALTIYREGQYQIELYTCLPNTETKVHSHPGIESIAVYLAGNLSFARMGGQFRDLSQYQKAAPDGTHMLLGKFVDSVDGTDHSLRVHKEGGAFLLFQKWHDKTPTSVAIEYDGQTLGHIHDETIKNAME